MESKYDIIRPDWKSKKKFFDIDLSKNVHYDKILNNKILSILLKPDYYFNYPDDFLVYDSISKYYKIPLENLTIGFGATDIINRLIHLIDLKKLYILNPSFAMVDIYCKASNLNYEFIEFDDLSKLSGNDIGIYIVNPNGNNGKTYEIKSYIDKFKYIICDEVYADFYPKNSLLNINKENILIIKSISKSLGLAGFRLGFCKSSNQFTKLLQSERLSQVTTTFSSIIIPKIINYTPLVIKRMSETKKFLENEFDCIKSFSNYVLFKSKNKYTDKFGFKKIEKYYRMALTDMETLINHK